MHICRYVSPAGPRWGLLKDGSVFELAVDPFGFPPVEGRTTQPELAPGPVVGPLDQVELLSPVTPSKIIAVGRNFAAHARELGHEVPKEPLIFFKPPSSVIGPGAPIRILPEMGRVDPEAELAVVIGRRGRHIRRERALDFVLGYTCGNDVSDRDFQRRDGQWARAKGFDTFCPLGPWIVTDLDPSDLRLVCRVNGEVRQNGTTADMVFDVPFLISTISHIMTLEPGDVILAGTPEGVSPIQPGDVVEIEIEGIGVLYNPVEGVTI